jgi:3-hydroxyisobutyrate dehydrogenase-like beta-hydroxyacid dehydrogenase
MEFAMTTVGVVGAGRMGMAILERICRAGFAVTVHDGNSDATSAAAEFGAVAGTLEEAAAADVVVVVVYTDAQAREVGVRLAGLMRPGSTIVNHTTGSPVTLRTIEAAGQPRGVRVLDAALSGGPHTIRAGTLTLLIGGEAEVLEDVRPVLASYSDPIIPVGELGAGQLTKLLNNALFGANVGLAAEAERIALSLGLDPAVTLAAVQHCSGATSVIGMTLATGSPATFKKTTAEFIVKDVAVVKATAAELGVDLGFLGTAADVGGS